MKNPLFRVCTYNIHKGFSSTNRKYLLNDIRNAIQQTDADIVFLQEVMGLSHRNRSQHIPNQLEFLADTLWQYQAYGKNAIYQQGHHGNAILSKYAFDQHKNINISQWRFSQRGLLLGKTSNGVYLICVHLGLFEQERRQQLKVLLKLIHEDIPEHAPLIIAGDFNDWNMNIHRQILNNTPLQEAYTNMHSKPALTFPSVFPVLAMDRIYYRHLQLIGVQVLDEDPWNKLSDHCAISASFQLST